MFLLVPAYPGCPGSKAVKRSLLLLLHCNIYLALHHTHVSGKKYVFLCEPCHSNENASTNCITVCATRGYINAANIRGGEGPGCFVFNHCSHCSTMKYMKLMHFLLKCLFYFILFLKSLKALYAAYGNSFKTLNLKNLQSSTLFR